MTQFEKLALETLQGWEELVWKHEEAFLGKFAKGNWDILLGVYWSAERMKIYYLLEDGQHVTDNFPIEEWFVFLDERTT